MEQYLKHMKYITYKLAAIGSPISEEDQLGSLPKSYTTLVRPLEACVENISLDYVQQALTHEELKQDGEQLTSGAEAALIGKPYKGKRETVRCSSEVEHSSKIWVGLCGPIYHV